MDYDLVKCRVSAHRLHGLARSLQVLVEQRGSDAVDGVAATVEVLSDEARVLAEALEDLDAASANVGFAPRRVDEA